MPQRLLFVAPLPPPVNGFSVISQSMLETLGPGFDPTIFDQSPSPHGGLRGLASEPIRLLMQAVKFATYLAGNRDSTVYIALSGGGRQLFDLMFLALAKLFGGRIVIHHHSFGYLKVPTRLTRTVLKYDRTAHHIALCDCMKTLLAKAYEIREEQILTLSNAAFVPENSEGADCEEPGKVTLGFLGNITREKGIMDFFALIRVCTEAKILVAGIVAGPVDEALKKPFFAELKGAPNVAYWGSVYGERKAAFFRSIDLLIFPSHYLNEAEPVTVLEAAAAGVTVLATSRGCIDEMLDTIEGEIISGTGPFSEIAAEVVQTHARQLEDRARLRAQAQSRFRQMKRSSLSDLAKIMDHMAHRLPQN